MGSSRYKNLLNPNKTTGEMGNAVCLFFLATEKFFLMSENSEMTPIKFFLISEKTLLVRAIIFPVLVKVKGVTEKKR